MPTVIRQIHNNNNGMQARLRTDEDDDGEYTLGMVGRVTHSSQGVATRMREFYRRFFSIIRTSSSPLKYSPCSINRTQTFEGFFRGSPG